MKKVMIISDSPFYRRNKASNIINDILTEIDNTPNTDWECLSIVSKGQWIKDLEYIDHMHVTNTAMLNKLKITGEGTFISAQLSLISKDIIKEMNGGYIVVSSEEVMGFLNLLENRYNNLLSYKETKALIEETEAKIKNLIKDEDFSSKKEILQTSLNKLKDKIVFLRKNLSLGYFNAEYGSSSLFYLLKKSKIIFSDKSSGIVVFKIRDFFAKSNQFTLNELNSLTEDYKNSTIFEGSVEENIVKYIKPFDSIDMVIEVPILFSDNLHLIKKEPIINIDILSSINMAGSVPIAPVKPSIAAAMLASGAGAKLDREVIMNSEPYLLKSAITPIEINETQFVDGNKEQSKTFTWEPQLGVFNKLRKEFEILT